MTLDNFVYQKT